MKKNPQVTLASLAKQMTKGFTTISHQLIQLTGETAFNRTEVEKLRSEMNQSFGEVDKRFELVDKRFEEINKRFDINDDTHQEILQAIDEMTDAKLTRHCKTYHNVVS